MTDHGDIGVTARTHVQIQRSELEDREREATELGELEQ